ncbi:hypothetical protein CNEO3_1190004 [Clostridium neonatale]|nr:hypothetical protein CNEO3_1190004 [Clostridium neonatale]
MDLFIMLVFIRNEVRYMSKLIPLEFKNQRIITTKVLADSFGTDYKIISNNFNRNIERFVEGKHYYKLEGQELKEFKGCHQNDESLKYVSILYLWTDRGAARHAKILDTDEAWEVYEELEDTYFKIKEKTQLISAEKHVKELQNTVAEFKRLTEEAKQQYKPSHKMKLDYSKMIRALTNTDEEYEMVKEWVFGNLGYTKWEDACIDDNNKIIDTIKTVARLISIKKMEQISMFNKSKI